MKILLVEDDDSFAEALATNLMRGPYKWDVVMAKSPEEAGVKFDDLNDFNVAVVDMADAPAEVRELARAALREAQKA